MRATAIPRLLRPGIPGALALALGLALAAPVGASRVPLERVVEETTCGSIVASSTHAFLVDDATRSVWVDLDAREWELDHPVEYRGASRAVATERYRLGGGAIRITAALEPERERFQLRIDAEPGADLASALALSLPGIHLPCEASGRLVTHEETSDETDPARVVRTYRLVHEATEALYAPDFAAAHRLLAEAQALAPDDPVVRWQRARVYYLAGESQGPDDRSGRLAAFRACESFADQAVLLAPDLAEGWLWRAIARGRILTTQGSLRVAFASLRGDRGPRFVAEAFERSLALGPSYARFGYSARADALYGLAQLYRLTPRGFWVRAAIDFEGDVDRSIELLRAALQAQPRRIEYAKELGAALLCRGDAPRDLDEARRVLTRALDLPVFAPIDQVDRAHVQLLLDGEGGSPCGYSRDGWREAELPSGSAVAGR